MTTLSAADLRRDQAVEYALRRYRDEALREVMAANRPRLLEVVKAIQPAALKAIEDTK